MNELRTLTCRLVGEMSMDDRVALSLSAGLDSITVGLAARELGKRITAYTFELQGYSSKERERVELIARHFGWPLKVVTVPIGRAGSEFKRLAIQYDCHKKTQFEVGFPLLHMLRCVEEREILTGFNADDHFGNTCKPRVEQARWKREGLSEAERMRRFDEHRAEGYAKFDADESDDTYWTAKKIAASYGKALVDPYERREMREYFAQFNHDDLSPFDKPLIRRAYASDLAGLPEGVIAKGERLQIAGRVDKLFLGLLSDPDINRFETRYTTVSALCQRWGREVRNDTGSALAELDRLPGMTEASVRTSIRPEYQPFSMEQVRQACAEPRFLVISTFAGGGGSSMGYRLAGGRVLMASEFVAEASRTYRANFPDVIVDERDIREIVTSRDSVADWLARVGMVPGELDILDGSPPCAEFSTAGRGIGEQDVLRPYSDVMQNNIASLPFDFVELAIMARPKVVVCENVPAFATRAKQVFDRVLAALRFPDGHSGRAYYANWAVLSASDFGVPQKRQRLFIIGIRRDVAEGLGAMSDDALADVFPAPTKVGVSIRSAFRGLDQADADVWPWRKVAMTSPLSRLMRLLPKNPPKPTRLGHVFPGYKKHYTLTRCSWDTPAPTMVVSGQRPDGLTGAIHPEEDRKFTLHELKRLTALPDDFVLTGTLGQAAERMCRMVPPLLTKAIAESVYKKVLLPYAEKVK
ncbi:DNA (cytosine-5-)-methyltransferase [Bradyrhizobium elkanii]|uniref:DNA (cytosine-5-)-methyltransferase n=1 Tax=Bradyrhizobium elkanii TaxID=29448 RepID=UPI0004B61A12|nr:DNA (cytosine-5-)-methyltransferase [Bradyrhizobium elkanii]